MPDFLDAENDENKKNKMDILIANKDLMAKKIKNIEQKLMKNKHTRKYLNKFNNSEFVRDMKGIKINIIDPGGQPILDAEGNIIGKTDPLLEMYYSQNQRLLISIAIKKIMKEYFIETEDLK